MTAIRAHFDGKAFVPDEPVQAAVNQTVTVLVPQTAMEGPKLTDEAFELLLAAMDRDAVSAEHSVDWSRDSVYSGTLDDPR